MHHLIRLFFCFWMLVMSLSIVRCARATDYDPNIWTARWNRDGSQFAISGVYALWGFDSNTLKMKSLLRAQLTEEIDLSR